MWEKFTWRHLHCNINIIREKREHHQATICMVVHKVLDEGRLNRMRLREGRRRGMKQRDKSEFSDDQMERWTKEDEEDER